jgi:putative hemolysin
LVAWLHRHQFLTFATTSSLIVCCLWAIQSLAWGLSRPQGDPWTAAALAFALGAGLGIPLLALLPQYAAARRPEAAARLTAPFLAGLVIVLSPLALALTALSHLVLMLLGVRSRDLRPPLTEEELRAMVAESEEQGTLPEPQRRMLYGVLDFADQTTAQVMTPRPDIVSVQADVPLREALAVALKHKFRRLPVYGENDDDIIGVLYLKDILPYLRTGDLDKPARVAARAAFFVPESLPAKDLLHQMQQGRQTIAIVRDEFGGTAGLVTVEDLLEEIVGDIRDEYDTGEEPEIVVLSENELLCDGQISLHRLTNLLQQPLPDEDYDSLAGFVLDLAGRIPRQGEQFSWHQLVFIVERVSGNRLRRIRVLRQDSPDNAEPGPQGKESA